MSDRVKLICPHLDTNNTHIAIYENGLGITYGELGRGVANLSSNILKTGVNQGSRIGLCFDNKALFVYGYMAILGANCIPVLLSSGLPAEKVAYILDDSGATGLLSNAKIFRKITHYPTTLRFVFLDDVSESSALRHIAIYSFQEGISSKQMCISDHTDWSCAAEALPPKFFEIASIIYTSGTTGRPKGVMLTETNLLVATSAIVQHLGLTTLDACIVTMSFAHCAGLLHLLAHLRVGAKLVTGETPALIGSFLAATRRHRVTILPGVPSFYMLLLKHSKQKIEPYLQYIRAVESSSAMMNGSLVEDIANLFPSATIFNTYGLTEAPRATYNLLTPSNPATKLSVGLPTPGVTIKVLNQQLQDCQPYEKGEIIINGPNLARGYWNNPEKTSAAFGADGFRTGDIGYTDKKGLLFLKGRKDDMIKVGAEAVYPHEIEEVITAYPGIADVLAYGVEDEIHGHTIHIKVVCIDKSIQEKAILDYCRNNLETFKIPTKITFCDFIPLEESGKPKRGI